jgi:hypothetical protein
LVYIKVVRVFKRVRVGTEACMWLSWVGEWAWLVLGFRMVFLHHTRQDISVLNLPPPPPMSPLVSCSAPLLRHLRMHLHLAPYDSIYNHKLI